MRDLKKILTPDYKGVTKKGSKFQVVRYIDCRTCEILTEAGNTLFVKPQDALKSNFKDPNHPSVHSVGYLGVGIHEMWNRETKKKTKEYQIWSAMIMRCYDEKVQIKKPYYVGCTVCEEWHNFQNFAKWYREQPKAFMDGYHLDKDLQVIGNKAYSPKTCQIINSRINCSIGIKSSYKRKQRGNGWEVSAPTFVNGCTKRRHFGTFETELAAISCYTDAKVKYFKDLAEYFKDEISEEVYDNLSNYYLLSM